MKKTLYIILALCLIMTLAACGGGGAGATSNGIKSNHKHCVCNGGAVNVGSHKTCANNDGWLEISTADELTAAMKEGTTAKPAYVALTADITVDAYMQVVMNKAVNICLNGHKLNASIRVIGELNITDCTGNGSIVGDKSFTLRTYAGAIVNMYAGTITTTGSKDDTQVVLLNGAADEDLQLAEADSTFTLYGGKIQAVGTTSKNGHSVYIESYGVMDMYNGVICDGNANAGGNIAVWGNYGVFTMYGGEVKDGKAGTSGGGNLFVYYGDAYVYGGTISGGRSAKYGGNISTNNKPGIMEFKNCTIKDGVAEGTNGGNVYLNGSTLQANFENVTISGGSAGVDAAGNGGNVFVNQVNVATFKDCTIKDGKSAYGSGLCVQGKEFLVELKGDMKFENNAASDIFMLYYKDTQSWLSVAELTTTSPIVIGAKKKMVFTEDTVANHPFVAISGMAVTESEGKLVINKN